MRSTRDLLRRRMHLMRQRAELLGHRVIRVERGASPGTASLRSTATATSRSFPGTKLDCRYNPRIVPAWENPTCEAFAVIRAEPWRLRVFPGSVLLGRNGKVLTWRK